MIGPGDPETWGPYCGAPNDPRTPPELDAQEVCPECGRMADCRDYKFNEWARYDCDFCGHKWREDING